jgi:endonuclease YncB( thermonuclease family)
LGAHYLAGATDTNRRVQEIEHARRPGGSITLPDLPGLLEGRVVRVSDGDTIVILKDRAQTRVRLLGIDAPEKAMPFGRVCRKDLASKVAGREVRIRSAGTDRYGRTLGKVLSGSTDVNLAMIEDGCAWHYKQYARNQEPSDRKLYAEAETKARASRVGLWRDADAQAPWEFRRDRRESRRR